MSEEGRAPRRCADCAWWDSVAGWGGWGKCRLRAPKVAYSGATWFPRTSGEADRCAEGARRDGREG